MVIQVLEHSLKPAPPLVLAPESRRPFSQIELHFDVFIPTTERDVDAVPPELDEQARTHAKTFLRLIGETRNDVTVSMCARCHIDSTGRYVGRLWRLPDTDATIWPLEGCPQPLTS